jgi:uncharacterized membrane protein YagU involved in acid resistance
VPAEVWNSIGTQKSVWYSFTFGIVADMFVLMAHLIFVVVLLFRYCLTASLLHCFTRTSQSQLDACTVSLIALSVAPLVSSRCKNKQLL